MITTKEHIIENMDKTIYGLFHIPSDSKKKQPLVICCHGFGSNCYDTSKFIGKPLAEAGFMTYCFDFCGGGPKTQSSFTMKEMSVMTEIKDLKAVIDHLKQLDFVDSSRCT